jgi:RNA polymerase sigma factor (sigma-70 family)
VNLDDEALERLVLEAKGGDAWAFGRIFDAFNEPIYRFIASRVNRPSDAEDLTQLVFVKALEALPRYEVRGIPFGGWLFRLARNTIIDHARTRHEHADLRRGRRPSGVAAGPDEVTLLRRDLDAVAAARRAHRRAARSHRAPVLRRPLGPRGGGRDGKQGRNGSGPPVPGNQGASGARSGWNSTSMTAPASAGTLAEPH